MIYNFVHIAQHYFATSHSPLAGQRLAEQAAANGDVRGTDASASMTAFCLIAIQESRALCADTVDGFQRSIDKAVTHLEGRLPDLKNPYAVAMTSYALANENKLNLTILKKIASPDLSHWPVLKGHIYTLEATAYALLALVKVKALEDAKPVVRWLIKQQKEGGGYGSTQATIMVYQAVAEYWTYAKEPEYNLDVDIVLPGRSLPQRYNFNRENQYTTRTSKISNINENVTVIARGTGEATVTMVSLYYTLPTEKESDCQKFNVSVQLIPDKNDKERKTYKLRIDVLYKDEERDATMSILDIGLLTGFTANTDDLSLLSKGRARTIAQYETNTVLSERGSLIIYLDKVSHTRPEEITFRIHQQFNVGVLQPAAVSVYEYYEQDCTKQKTDRNNAERIAMVCERTETSETDFVYKVRLEELTESKSTDIYTMQILEVIKEGSDPVVLQHGHNETRTFLGYQHCRVPLDLRKGKTYLIMGTSDDIYRDHQDESFQYVFGEKTWIEYWPTETECETVLHKPTCSGMENVKQHALTGCH